MHPYLTRLGIRPEVQEFFRPFYKSDENGNLCFTYGQETEAYGMGFHYLPCTANCWLAGNHFEVIRKVIISSSAMEAIAWLNCHYDSFNMVENILFVSAGSNITIQQLGWISEQLQGRKYALLFGRDLLGNICDLNAASIIKKYPLAVAVSENIVTISFRHKQYNITSELFSLNAFERLSGFRFNIPTCKPKNQASWLNELQTQSFSL